MAAGEVIGQGQNWRVEVVERGRCIVCEQRIQDGPYMGKKITLAEATYVLDDNCAHELADSLHGRKK